MIGSGEPRPTPSKASSTDSTKKPRYLKTASSPRSKTIAAISARLRAAGDSLPEITRAATVLTSVEAISSSTQRQSIQP